MGKLLDTLQRAAKSSNSAIGFLGRAATASKPKAGAIVVTVGTDAAAVAAHLKAGADIVIVPIGTAVDAAKGAGVAWGVDARTSEKLTGAELRAIHEQGADFVLLPSTVTMRVVSEPIEHFERVLTVTPPKDDPLLLTFRALNLVSVDAAVLDLRLNARDLANMTVPDFTHLRTLCETLRFPKIITVQGVPATEDVRTLAHLGAAAIWMTNATPEEVGQLREALEQVPRDTDSLGTALGNLPGGASR